MARGITADQMLFTIVGSPPVLVERAVHDNLPEVIRAVKNIAGVVSCEAYINEMNREQHIRVKVVPLGGRHTSVTLKKPIISVLNAFAANLRYFSGKATVTFVPSSSQRR